MPHCSARAAALSGARRSSVRRRRRSTSSREYIRSREEPGAACERMNALEMYA